MMGSSHAATGVAVGGFVLAGLSALGAPISVPEAVAGAVLCAGAALLPDLDHPASTATLSQGPVSQAACRGVRALSARVWRATRTKYDRGGHDADGTHRHLSHTVPAAVAVGAAVALSGVWVWSFGVVLWLVFSLSVRGVAGCFRSRPLGWVAASGMALAATVLALLAGTGPVLAASMVALGMVVHVLGDALTRAGVPLAWPVPVRGARWRMLGAPVRFTTGRESVSERLIRAVSLVSTVPSAVLALW